MQLSCVSGPGAAQATVKLFVWAEVLLESSTGGQFTLRLIHTIAWVHFLLRCWAGTPVLAGCWQRPPCVLATWASPQSSSQRGRRAPIRVSRWENQRGWVNWSCDLFVAQSWKWHPFTSCYAHSSHTQGQITGNLEHQILGSNLASARPNPHFGPQWFYRDTYKTHSPLRMSHPTQASSQGPKP